MSRTMASRVFVVALLGVHAALLVVGARSHSPGIDEPAHIAAGLAHWKLGVYSLYRVNPPLVDMVCALPVMAAGPRLDFRRLVDVPGVRSEWNVGWDFAREYQTRIMLLMVLARLPIVVASVLGGWLVFLWGRTLYGTLGGCLGLMLWCFDPLVLGWGQVVTGDIPAATAALGASYAFRNYLVRPSWRGAALAGALLGVGLLTKFTLLVFFGLWPLLVLVYRPWRFLQAPRWRTLIGQGVVVVVLSLLVLNLGYGFRGTGSRLGNFPFVSRQWSGQNVRPGESANRFRETWLGAVPMPVPADYVLGIDALKLDFEDGFESYLGGTWRASQGWWYYYLYGLAVKEPVGTLLLILGAICVSLPTCRPSADVWGWLLPGLGILAFISSQDGYSGHVRYVLPALPFLMVGTASLGRFLTQNHRAARAVLVGLVAWSTISSLRAYPHAMSYFNEPAGGPENGSAHLSNSNIDWGQDLLHLKSWLDAHPEARPLGLAYYNYFDPRFLGVDYRLPAPGLLGGKLPDDPAKAQAYGPHPGYYAVSENFLVGEKFMAPDGRGGMQMVSWSDCFGYFNKFTPIARSGYSIRIYYITPEQADTVRRQLGFPPLSAQRSVRDSG